MLLANIIWARRGHLRTLIEGFRSPKYEPLGFDPAEVGLFPLNRWTLARPLQRSHLQVSVTEVRPQQQWFNQAEWQRIADEFGRRYTGDIGFLTDALTTGKVVRVRISDTPLRRATTANTWQRSSICDVTPMRNPRSVQVS